MNRQPDFSSSGEDDFPDLDAILQRSIRQQVRCLEKSSIKETTGDQHGLPERGKGAPSECRTTRDSTLRDKSSNNTKAPSNTRRRKLGQRLDNPLLKPFEAFEKTERQNSSDVPMENRRVPSVTVRRLRNPDRAAPFHEPDEDSEGSEHETTEIAEADISEFLDVSSSEIEDDDHLAVSGPGGRAREVRRPSVSALSPGVAGTRKYPSVRQSTPDSDFSTSEDSEVGNSQENPNRKERPAEKPVVRYAAQSKSALVDLTGDLTDALRLLDLDKKESRREEPKRREVKLPRSIAPSTPKKQPTKNLVSPKKLPGIPKTPHGPSTDLFWSQEFVDDWNEEHSPKKLFLPRAQNSPVKKPTKSNISRTENMNGRETRKAFEKRKHEIAQAFLRELDETITQGKLQSMAESTGGIKINWSSKLNTTAGRANWRRETVRRKLTDGTEQSVSHRHHASIELAEKVIDDENRLLNVVAHEFCHLANFMVNGITGNPHGKEFKAWAVQCSRAFSDRGIEVTTKHSYEIDFKYVWECTECGLEYKRHSKSINPDRHRCGSCKSLLKQKKPVPRAASKPSEYQLFFKEQMKVVREEHPKSPQNEVMKIIAERWAARGGSDNRVTPASKSSESATEAAVDKAGALLRGIAL
ncbi:sprt family metallopeptidase [Colletotrichum sojae]|uniref:Sprt family metallopeptidase n=1 Tax=Colletotrichum sojae TaxID=2175907 RepID=A0A8H6JG40_9PEZI|nr:sprt family metallopeptidase [Colletotrichum sojae]